MKIRELTEVPNDFIKRHTLKDDKSSTKTPIRLTGQNDDDLIKSRVIYCIVTTIPIHSQIQVQLNCVSHLV